MSMSLQNVASTEQHSDGLNQAIQSPSPPSYEEEVYLPSYEEAISDRVPDFPASALKLEGVIKFMCSPGDYLVEQALQLGEDVLDLDIEVEQNLIYACAIYPITREIFTPYIQEHRIHLFLAGFRWARVVEGNEDVEWGVERVEAINGARGYERGYEADDETDDETDNGIDDEIDETDNEEPSQMSESGV
ncbi:uncharacterized protein Bfra_010916 [Botrytis fragariae]|uniref:Uncharacterized protein n=1 Tax=Botrytis fragariae TaxID=1964551 RepID=A0A8H6EEY6_9HELO|nr:uncharacterized protein Bfra_010916 [Botrytis fragariae]KAF5869716.1 hypothetical protein Bfra_010916 [Botrytis fragariae]